MKRSARTFAAVMACFLVPTGFATIAEARPPYLSVFVEVYPALKQAVNAVEKGNCNICHDANSTSKRGRSEYGRALGAGIEAATGQSGKLNPADPAEKQALIDAIKKAAEAKNRSGKTFGSVIEAGRLPVPVAPKR